MGRLIYADNAATTQLDKIAFDAMLPFLQEEFGNASSLYSFSRSPKKAIAEARQIIANCINAAADEIIFTSGGTEADNWAIKGVALKHRNNGKHIITSEFEHHAVLCSCSFLEELGYSITYIPVENNGHISAYKLSKALRTDTTLVSIMLANNEIGTIQNISEFSKIAHKNKTIFHCDAVQAIGHISVDVKTLDIDLLSVSAHKFNGPKGVGFMYLKKGTDLLNWSSGGKQENGHRAGTENVASIVGMAVALKKNVEKIDENTAYLDNLSKLFLAKLSNSNVDFIVNGDSNRLPGNINISIKNQDGEALLHRLDIKSIIVSTGSACMSGKSDPSHVIKAIGTPQEYATGTIRISLSKDNTVEDVLAITEAITSIVASG
jgi:cysteine desulfurase